MSRSVVPFAVVAGIGVVAGGLVSAAAAGAPSYTSSWAVAYLVLVVGVAQLALGVGQAHLAADPPSDQLILVEIVVFNVANIAILAGTVFDWIVLVYAGSGLFIVALALFLWAVRLAKGDHVRLLYGFRIVVAALIISAGVGLVIASV